MPEKTTRQRVRELATDEPNLNMTDIAGRLGVSRERVRQIVDQESLNVPRGVTGIRSRKAPAPPAPRILTGGVAVKITHTAAGLIGELLVAADLTARGYVVFFPLSRTSACDLVSLSPDGLLEKIEVRCGTRHGGTIRYNRKLIGGVHDRYAIVVTGEPVVYRPELPS